MRSLLYWMTAALVVAALVLTTGCASTGSSGNDDERITVASVQKNIRIGMSGDEVASVLGSPNIVTTDSERREVWIYDKISQEVSQERSSLYGTVLVIGGSSSSRSSRSSERTLTVIVKYNQAGTVRDFAYRTSRF